MEHSILHGLQLCGLILALGGCLFWLLVLHPVLRRNAQPSLHDELEALVGRWVFRAALLSSIATGSDLFVQIAELEGRTVYGPVNLAVLGHYISGTTVGGLTAGRAFLLLALALFCRGRISRVWPLLLATATAAAVASTLVSHSAALPVVRAPAIAAQFIHITAGAFWIGMLACVFLVTQFVRKNPGGLDLLAAVVRRFSPFALAGSFLLMLSGIYSAYRFIVSPAAVLVSAYGLTLGLKLLLLGVVLCPAYLNWRMVQTGLSRVSAEGERAPLLLRFSRLLELELTAGIMVIAVAGILGAISPPASLGDAQLTPQQWQAVVSPSLPPFHLADPRLFVGAAQRTADDLRYSEFTHRWSGVFVILLGLCWLGQSVSRSAGRFAKIWPLLLLLFGLFVAAVADPEVWILRTYSVAEVLASPQVLEHQIGAVLVFVIALMGLKEAKSDSTGGPLGSLLPIVMIAGSLMLLGHAHSSFSSSEELGNLINFQHAIIGSFGLLAGVFRWVQIRGLLPSRPLNFVWPGCIVLLGLFMAFFYRELTSDLSPSRSPSISEYVETT